MFPGAVLVTIALCLICVPNMSSAAECAKLVNPFGNQKLQYQDRGDRCEGLFAQPVAASAHIKIIAFFDHTPALPETIGRTISLVASGATSESHIFFRSVSARYRQYYRMDAKADSAGRFVWKTEIVKALNLAARELMVLACDDGCDGAEPRLLPISGLDGDRQATTDRVLIFASAVDLAKVFVKLTRVVGDQTIENDHDLLEGQILPAGSLKSYYGLSGRPPGLYRIKITAIPRYNDAADQSLAILQLP
jgi:hypothetical protein